MRELWGMGFVTILWNFEGTTSPIVMNEWVLTSTCKQLVWSTRIGRNMPIWILCLILGSGPGEALTMEVTRRCSRVIGTQFFFGQNFRFVLGGLSLCFNCSIPRARFASHHHTRETLKRLVRAHSSLHRSLSLSLSHQSKFLSFRFLKY